MNKNLTTKRGKPYPLGATVCSEGVNFALFSEHASSVELLLFENHDSLEPFRTITLDPFINRTFYIWHVFVPEITDGTHYAYRVDGPWDPANGLKFDRHKLLIDPYARGNTDTLWKRKNALVYGTDNSKSSMKSVVINCQGYDWEGVEHPRIPLKDTVIYEMHVGGFTKSHTSKVSNPGTFNAVIEKIPYLKELGVTAIELLPIFDFDEHEILRVYKGRPLKNYWGYSTIGFFAPDSSYCIHPESGKQIKEFRDMVKALHRAGIEIILDVVFNHTEEGDHTGPVIHFKGLDNLVYYHLDQENKNRYRNFSGCGNAVNCNHPIVTKFISECLRFWVQEMHVDGFRFDLGSILARGIDGKPMKYPPVLWNIELSDAFADTKLIAEAWDAAGLYQVGSFPGQRWSEWNGQFRDDIRRFFKGEKGMLGRFASRIAGSRDIYSGSLDTPSKSINFITAHDGFTLMDLVSYSTKRNFDNGENNIDGSNDNYSFNCGYEGESDDWSVVSKRKTYMKSFISILLISRGIPMILSGDEIGRSQAGNNNAYCQDNEISWMNWDILEKNKDLFNYFRKMIDLRKSMKSLRENRFFIGGGNGRKDIVWYSPELSKPDWDNIEESALAFTITAQSLKESDIHVMINMGKTLRLFRIPDPLPNYKWKLFADTTKNHPNDIYDAALSTSPIIDSFSYTLAPGGVVILLSSFEQ